MTKRFIFTILIIVMMFIGVSNVYALTFEDAKGHWAEEFIDWVSDKGYLIGDDTGMFRPNAKITKAEVVVILNRLMNTKQVKEFTYTDVAKKKWYYEDIGKGLFGGIIDDGETFEPESDILREDSMLMIARAYGLEFNEKSVEKFSDHETITQKGAVGALVDAGIVHGCSDGSLQPKRELHRGEFAKMVRDIVGAIGTPEERTSGTSTDVDIAEDNSVTVTYTIFGFINKPKSMDELSNTAVFKEVIEKRKKSTPPEDEDVIDEICNNNEIKKDIYSWSDIKWTYPDDMEEEDEILENTEIRGDITATKKVTVNFKKQIIPEIESENLTDLERYDAITLEQGKALEEPGSPSDLSGSEIIEGEDSESVYKFAGWYLEKYAEDLSEYDFETPVNNDTTLVALFRKVQKVSYTVKSSEMPINLVSFTKDYLYGDLLGESPTKEEVIEEICKEQPEYSKCYDWSDLSWVYPSKSGVGKMVLSDLAINGEINPILRKIDIFIEIYVDSRTGYVPSKNNENKKVTINCGESFIITPSDYVQTGVPGNPNFYFSTDGVYIVGEDENDLTKLEGYMSSQIETPKLFEDTVIYIRYRVVN